MASVHAWPVSGPKSWLKMEAWSPEINVPSTNVTGSAVMQDGRLLLADGTNQVIILLDKDFNIQSTAYIPCWPADMTVYGEDSAVVILPGQEELAYIRVLGEKIQVYDSFRLDCLGCWSGGVAAHDGEVYVLCGHHNCRYVQVLDKRRVETRSIGPFEVDFQSKCSFMYQGDITVGTGGTLYHSYKNGNGTGHITCRTNVGDVVYDVQHEGDPRGMVVDEEGNLLVCCYKSNTIEVLGKDGVRHKVILSSDDGVVRPQSVSYRRSDQTLIVTMNNSPSCRAYKLK